MIVKIICAATLLAVCSGESPQRLVKSNQAISSQSFNREDVPVSYKFTSIHTYPKSKSNSIDHPIPHAIQYAPVLQKSQPNEPKRYTEVVFQQPEVQQYNIETTTKPTNLEPLRISSDENKVESSRNKEYVPGHNIEVLQSVNRNPGHNAVYRSYGNEINHVPSKVNHLRNYVLNQHHNPDITSHTVSPTSTAVTEGTTHYIHHPAVYALLGRHAYSPNAYALHDVNARQIPHQKTHRLHLNVARLNGFAQAIPKAPKFPFNSILPIHDKYVQSIRLPETNHLNMIQQKTLLYPIQDKTRQYSVKMP